VPSPGADSFSRAPFTAGDADALVAFCAAQRSPYDERLLRQLLLQLTSDPSGVFVIRDADGIVLVATVIDRAPNGAGAASIETLAVRTPLPAPTFTRLVAEPAIAFARAGACRALHVALPTARLPSEDAERALRDLGFAPVYDSFEMRRPASVRMAPPDPLPAGWSWAALDGARADAAHAALAEIFRDAPSTNLMPVADFRRGVISGAARWRVLLDGTRIAGLVRAVPHGDRGELRIVGRVPAYRGRGLGPRLVAEGLSVLARRSDGDGEVEVDVDLQVEADNDRALDLYRRFGFEVTARTPVFGLAFRG
jgi:ribosomal protein S18 acetylase RimI-like enzyme